jgi:hypothetical protein
MVNISNYNMYKQKFFEPPIILKSNVALAPKALGNPALKY